jgi:hypothetical protein
MLPIGPTDGRMEGGLDGQSDGCTEGRTDDMQAAQASMQTAKASKLLQAQIC